MLEQCAAKSASVHIMDVDDIEDMPQTLETYVRARNPLDLALSLIHI